MASIDMSIYLFILPSKVTPLFLVSQEEAVLFLLCVCVCDLFPFIQEEAFYTMHSVIQLAPKSLSVTSFGG